MKNAVVIGATGLVGSELVALLLSDERFETVTVFTRRSLKLQHPKLLEHLIDFDQYDSWQHQVKGDVLFSALGTTLKQAGSKAAQYHIDYTYQYHFAKAAAESKVSVYVLVSAAAASPDSKMFYSKMKGELERDVKQLPFSSIYFLQPSLLVGKRDHSRLGEKFGERVLAVFNALGLFRKYRAISGKTVAQAMINAALTANPGVHVYALDDVFTLAGSKG
ncbi:putative NADH dehydrogenase with NAD(P)-binding domain [Pedobacter sp. BAL39]|uniref:NAD(P)H-binding protein n=1 Tax=Pedobacter sp. BAL39 TaxID=391596 RepID=UPI00015597D3|nr:NAD(P)H-binding protein [Pedobacter sp. BAL39]EDM37721.1 putative NADH dehydrogenase with NAD(P)-binding domain [Pedobacter sp. BAL39]